MTQKPYENFSISAPVSGLTIYATYESLSQVYNSIVNIQDKIPSELYPFVGYGTPPW